MTDPRLFPDLPKAKAPPAPRRRRMPDALQVWVENRFFGGRVARKQGSNFGDAVNLFREKGLGPEELELRCWRHDDRWGAHCGPVTLRSLMAKIDELAQPTDAEKKRAAERSNSERRRATFLKEREAAKAECARYGHDFPRRPAKGLEYCRRCGVYPEEPKR